MLKIESNRKTAFTLMETLITVVILGILAAILVPNLIKNQVKNANRTKVKMAMAAYEKAINMMIIENDIKSTEALRELGQDNCQYTKEYFKTVQDGINNCIFKTADRVWWDITDITNPIISLKDEITDANVAAIANNALSLNTDKNSFALIGRFDDLGTLRVNDNAYEQGLSNNSINQAYMIKLWHFINNSNSLSSKEQFVACKARGQNSCTIALNGKNITYTKVSAEDDIIISKGYGGSNICIYNRDTRKRNCDGSYKSIVEKGDYYIINVGKISQNDAKNEETCAKSIYANCASNGDYYEAAKIKCEKYGGHLANMAEIKMAYNNGQVTSNGNYGCISYEEIDPTYYNAMTNKGEPVNGWVNKSSSGKNQVICVGNE